MRIVVKTIFFIFILTNLVACGGGGSGGSTQSTKNTTSSLTSTAAVDDNVEVLENSPAANTASGGKSTRTIKVLDNDTISSSATTISIASVTSPTKLGGTTSINQTDNTITYTPPPGSNITDFDVFEYTIVDNVGNKSTGVVTVVLKSTICLLTSVLCIGPGEEFDTNVPNQETVFAAAISSAKPGDILEIRGGTYQHDIVAAKSDYLVNVTVSGTSSNPITIKPYNNEKVIFKGFGYTEGTAGPSRKNEVLFRVMGNYIHVQDLDISYASKYGMEINGSFGNYENLTVHDNWMSNIAIGQQPIRVEGNVLSHIESYRSRHQNGIYLIRMGITNANDLLINNTVEYSLSYDNGREPNGNIVPAITGDPQGGGNSDGIASFKDCNDAAASVGVGNLCPGNTIKGNIVWHNTDDGIDVGMTGGSKYVDNISFNNGPNGNIGFKNLRYNMGDAIYVGNVSLDNGTRGYEFRMNDEDHIYNNTAVHVPEHGISIYANNPTPTKIKFYNNLSAFNGGIDFVVPGNIDNLTNWAEDTQGNPQIVNSAFTASSVNTTFPAGLSIPQKLDFIRNQFVAALKPKAGSPLIDAGTYVPGIHCTTADDDLNNPMPAGADCRHWKGSAPDIGAFEY